MEKLYESDNVDWVSCWIESYLFGFLNLVYVIM